MSKMNNYLFATLLIVAVSFLSFRDRNPVFASAETTIDSPINKVWEVQSDLNKWQLWNSDIQSMRVNGVVAVGTVFMWKAGGLTIESTITEFQPNQRIAWKGRTTGIDAYHVWVFKEIGNTTKVYTEETFTGPLAWLLPGTMRGQIKSALHHGLVVLKKAAESAPV